VDDATAVQRRVPRPRADALRNQPFGGIVIAGDFLVALAAEGQH
jgi:hypothetical protein